MNNGENSDVVQCKENLIFCVEFQQRCYVSDFKRLRIRSKFVVLLLTVYMFLKAEQSSLCKV